MSKFLKQAKIKDRQAENWMTVCHHAMHLFPELFPTGPGLKPIHGYAANQICGLLTELAGHRLAAESREFLSQDHLVPPIEWDGAGKYYEELMQHSIKHSTPRTGRVVDLTTDGIDLDPYKESNDAIAEIVNEEEEEPVNPRKGKPIFP